MLAFRIPRSQPIERREGTTPLLFRTWANQLEISSQVAFTRLRMVQMQRFGRHLFLRMESLQFEITFTLVACVLRLVDHSMTHSLV